jgi:hypothetical protein
MKYLINIILIVLAIILQTSVFSQFQINNSMPNIIMLVIISLIFISRQKEALLWLIVGSLLLDMSSPFRFGYYFLTISVLFFILLRLTNTYFANPSLIFSALLFFLASIILDLPIVIISYNSSMPIIMLLNGIYNVIIGVVLYYFLDYYYRPKDSIRLT